MSKPTDSLIRLSEVLQQTGNSKTQCYREMKNGTHPQPIRRGRVCLWSQNEINEYIEQLKAGERGVRDANVKNVHLRDKAASAA